MFPGDGTHLPGRETASAAHLRGPSYGAEPPPAPCSAPGATPPLLEHHTSCMFPDSADVLLRAASEDTFDDDDYGFLPDEYSRYLGDGGSEEEGGLEYTDEEMVDPAAFGVIGEPYACPTGGSTAAGGFPDACTGAWGEMPGCFSKEGGLGGASRANAAFFVLEADCRAAWGALQPAPALKPAPEPLPWYAAQRGAQTGVPSTGGMASGMGAAAGDAHGCSGGGGGGGCEPYAPQSTERRRRPRRKWDSAVDYERITRCYTLSYPSIM